MLALTQSKERRRSASEVFLEVIRQAAYCSHAVARHAPRRHASRTQHVPVRAYVQRIPGKPWCAAGTRTVLSSSGLGFATLGVRPTEQFVGNSTAHARESGEEEFIVGGSASAPET